MSRTINTRDIRDQDIAQSGPEYAPITPGGATPLTVAGKGPQYRLPEVEGPSATEITSGNRPTKRNRRLQNIIKCSREEKKIIFLCYQVFQNNIWGWGESIQMFREQLEKSGLDQEGYSPCTFKCKYCKYILFLFPVSPQGEVSAVM